MPIRVGLDEFLHRGGTALDIGACQGLFTSQFWQGVEPNGQVIAIEPHADRADWLRERGATQVLSVALSDREGPTTLYLSAQPEHASLYPANVLVPTGDPITVRGATLDGLVASGELPPVVDVIKIDAQGAEAAILRGASHYLGRRQAVWYLELWPLGLRQAGASLQAIADRFTAYAYHPADGESWAAVLQRAAACEGHSSIDVLVLPAKGMV